MMRSILTKLAVATGGVALSLSAAAGVASAQPNIDAMVNSTCTYDQWVAALHAQSPGPASAFDAQPQTQAFMRRFLAAPPQRRVQMAQTVMRMPGAEENFPVVQQAFGACNNF